MLRVLTIAALHAGHSLWRPGRRLGRHPGRGARPDRVLERLGRRRAGQRLHRLGRRAGGGALRRRAGARQADRHRRGGRPDRGREGVGPQRRRLGRSDLDQRREFRRDEAAGPAVRPVRGIAAEFSATSTRQASPPRSSTSRFRPRASRRPGAWRSSSSCTIPRACRSRRARCRRCSTGPRPIRDASPIRRRRTSSAAPSSSRS